jgi:hypothetical protein
VLYPARVTKSAPFLDLFPTMRVGPLGLERRLGPPSMCGERMGTIVRLSPPHGVARAFFLRWQEAGRVERGVPEYLRLGSKEEGCGRRNKIILSDFEDVSSHDFSGKMR